MKFALAFLLLATFCALTYAKAVSSESNSLSSESHETRAKRSLKSSEESNSVSSESNERRVRRAVDTSSEESKEKKPKSERKKPNKKHSSESDESDESNEKRYRGKPTSTSTTTGEETLPYEPNGPTTAAQETTTTEVAIEIVTLS